MKIILSHDYHGICRPYAFARFRDYETAEEAFTTLDFAEFNGRKLHISFARNSIVSEDVYRQRSKNVRFNVTVHDSRPQSG